MAHTFLFHIGQLASKMFAAERSMLELCEGAAFGHVSNSFGPVAAAFFLEPDIGMARGVDMFRFAHFDAVNVRSRIGTLAR